MKKPVYIILAVILLFSGCGQGNKAPGNTNLNNAGSEIVMWLIGSEAQALTIREIGEEFYKKTGIKVRCDAISWGDAHSKYLTSIAGGVAPDIGTMGLTWGTEFGNLNAMVDLKARYSSEIADIKESVFKGLWNSVEYNGKVYGIPFDMTEYVLYYRKDMVKNPPATWEELKALLVELNKSGKGMIFDWGSISWIGYSSFLWQAGGNFYNKDYTEIEIDSPQAVLAMNFFADLYKKYGVPKTKIPLEQGMRTGDFPLAISGNWKIDDLKVSAPEIYGKWSIATLPKGPGGRNTTFIGGRVIGIFEQSKNKESAWQFIKFLSSPESQIKLYEASLSVQDTYLPPSKKSWDILNMDKDFKKVLVDQANDSKGPPPVANWDSNARYVDEAIQRVVLQDADAKTELDRAKDYINKTSRR